MTKKTEAPQRWPQHKMGKFCGYNEYEDGSIEVAPSHSDTMDRAELEREAVDTLIASINSHCLRLMKVAAQLRRNFWASVKEDYGLDYEKYDYSYDYHSKRISRTPRPPIEVNK